MTERVVQDQGGDVGNYASHCYTLSECKNLCDENSMCTSFSYNDCACHLKDKCLTSGASIVDASAPNANYRTYYKTCEMGFVQVGSMIMANATEPVTAVHGGDTVWLRASTGKHLTVEKNSSVHAFSGQR